MAKNRRFSLGARMLGAVCVLLSIGAIVWILVAGFGLGSGGVLALSAVGIVAPCVLAGESVAEIAMGIVELVIESIGTLVEAVIDFFSSLF